MLKLKLFIYVLFPVVLAITHYDHGDRSMYGKSTNATKFTQCDVCYNGGTMIEGQCSCYSEYNTPCCQCLSTVPESFKKYHCPGDFPGMNEQDCMAIQDYPCCWAPIPAGPDCYLECKSPRFCKTGDTNFHCEDGCGQAKRQQQTKISQYNIAECKEDDISCTIIPTCCTSCQNNTGGVNDAYLLQAVDDDHIICIPKCNWLDHHCWPGICDADNGYLASTCSCTKGFRLVTTDSEIHSYPESTTCELTQPADIKECFIRAESEHGEIADSKIKGNNTDCASTVNGYVNFIIHNMSIKLSTAFELPEDPPSPPHNYVESFSFGVTEVITTVGMYYQNGSYVKIMDQDLGLIADDICNIGNFSTEYPVSHLITCEHQYPFDFTTQIQDGQRNYYDRVILAREVCFYTDLTPPDHCVHQGCVDDLLNLGHRVRNDNELIVSFYGWFDPQPQSTVANASGLSHFEIEVRDVIYTPTELYADFKSISTTICHGQFLNISLPFRNEASMYAVYLWALDSTQESPNYRVARRFVLVDNNSTININDTNPIVVTSASNETEFHWQINLSPIEVSWKSHFYNTWHVHTNLLLPIRSERNLSISGPFEQESGELPVTGTPNKDGIVKYVYKYHQISNITEEMSEWTNTTNGLDEKESIVEIIPSDGDWINISIKAIDIMNNTLEDYIILKIDSTPPTLRDMHLNNDGYKVLVHNETDLSTMDMKFEAYDKHSGMKQVSWKLGTFPGGSDLNSGHEAVQKNVIQDNCTNCYCPMVYGSECEIYKYTVQLGGLIGNKSHGQHNREYYFTFTVINNAELKTTEQVIILVDISPPEPGHVFDGNQGEKDRDFQSEPIISWYWTGFIDHESGISTYYIAIGDICFTTEEIELMYINNNMSGVEDFKILTETFYKYRASHTGFYRISVIAFNGAMEPSNAVCSTGVVYDNTPPNMYDMYLSGSVHQRSLICYDNKTWYLNSQGILYELHTNDQCNRRCVNENDTMNSKFTQISLSNETGYNAISENDSITYCTLYPSYSTNSPIFLHTDNIHLTWKTNEPDSQINNYYITIASSPYMENTPDVIGPISTNNRTDYKCINCGLNQGKSYYVTITAQNKAGLEEMVIIGPIIIDATPPYYDGGMDVSVSGENTTLSWNPYSFVDEDYDVVLTEYEWALGSGSMPEEVVSFTKYVFPYDSIETLMTIVCPTEIIQTIDQDQGNDYYFTLKAYNKANLYHIEESETFVIHSKIKPTHGTVWHVNSKHEEIAFQEENDVLCVEWHGFQHHSEKLSYSIGIGSQPELDDIAHVWNVSNSSFHCVSNLLLELDNMYYVTVIASSAQEQASASTKGIYVTTMVNLFNNSKVSINGNCPNKFQYIFDSDTTPSSELVYSVNIPRSSHIYFTLRMKITASIESFHQISVYYENEPIPVTTWSWDNDSQLLLYYQFIQVYDNITVTVLNEANINIVEVALDPCQSITDIQPRKNAIDVNWFFDSPHIRNIDSFHLSVYSYGINDNSSLLIVQHHITASEKNMTLHVGLDQGQVYSVCVKPCFQFTCVQSQICEELSVDLLDPRTNSLEASIDVTDDDIRDSNFYILNAKWEAFLQKGVDKLQSIEVYDWSVALDEFAAGLLLPWERLIQPSNQLQMYIEVNQTVYLHAKKYRSMYFIVRSTADNGMVKLKSSLIKLLDLQPPSGVQVFDLPPEYDLNEIKDSLGSSNLGRLSRDLYNSDIDFTRNVEKVSGALLGITCTHYTWTLQLNMEGDCTTHQTIPCLTIKESDENIIAFSRQNLEYTSNYTICVSGEGSCPSFRSCSNGFVVDIQPPTAGYVTLGHGTENYSDDSTTKFVSWNGFMDIEQYTDIAYAHGINKYSVAIGSVPYGTDIIAYRDEGISDHCLVKGLSLYNGRMYYATIKACDHVGMCTEVSSNGVLIDNSPPKIGAVNLHLSNIISDIDNGLLIRWEDITDSESGIAKIEISVGSSNTSQDVVPFMKVSHNYVEINEEKLLLDGHTYFATVKATNKVGLWSTKSSLPLLYDSSPPEIGFVRHGLLNQVTSRYTQDDSSIKCHWGGFSDPHTGVFYYRIAIGSQPYGEDILYWKDMGTKTEFEQMDMRLQHGKSYYITVEACNYVLLCSKAVSSSLIVDNTAPIPGQVHVGYSYDHEQYIFHSNSISVRWTGFQDLQSQISHYYWCISTLYGHCDVIPMKNAHKATHITEPNTELSVNITLIATVMAVNHVNLSVSATSKHFIIDNTPPEIINEVKITTVSSLMKNTQFDTSYVSLQWLMIDYESPMAGYTVTIHAHHDGISPSCVHLGDVHGVTIPLTGENRLKDGNNYTVIVSGCNAAQVCTSSVVEDLLVDSSPPLIGGFVEPMYWESITVTLAWKGFEDPHSGISHYYISVSSSYSGSNLSGGVVKITHDENNQTQMYTLVMSEYLLFSDLKNDTIYLTIVSENKVGLKSDAAKASVYLFDGGKLDIQNHSCDIHYCNNDCTCAVLNEGCNYIDEQYECNPHNATESDQQLKVYTGMYNNSMVFTPSTACIPGFWISNYNSSGVQRYEWSVSMAGQPTGVGLDDISMYEFFDVELFDRAVFCTSEDLFLDGSYIFHVKVWQDFFQYTHYVSDSVIIDASPPYINYGKNVLDLDSTMTNEVHYKTDTDGIYSCWDNVFSDPESGIAYYLVSIGSSPSGNEMYGPVHVGLSVNISFTEESLKAGFHYYTTVYAYNNVGMVERSSSKGVLIDLEKPYTGSVFTGHNYTDNMYQNGYEIKFSWFGFVDRHSHVKSYQYAIVKKSLQPAKVFFQTTFLQNHISIPGPYEHGEEYEIYMKASDAAGHKSSIVKSNPIFIDQTPPVLLKCNATYELTYSARMNCKCENVSSLVYPCICKPHKSVSLTKGGFYYGSIQTSGRIDMKTRLELSDITEWAWFQRVNKSYYEHNMYFIAKQSERIVPVIHIERPVSDEVIFSLYKCTKETTGVGNIHDLNLIRQWSKFVIYVNIPIYDPESDIESVEVGLGTNPGGFQLLPMSSIGTENSFSKPVKLQHKMKVYAIAVATNKAGDKMNFNLDPITVDWTPPEVDNLNVTVKQGNLIKLHVSWAVKENESYVTDCLWAIGYHAGTDDMYNWDSTDTFTTAEKILHNLKHGDIIYISIKCCNSLDMCESVISDPTVIVIQPPNSEKAYVEVYPQQHTIYSPTENTQFSQQELEFTHHGFRSITAVDHYEYKIVGYGDDDQWINTGKQDYVHIDNMVIDIREYDIRVRAVNTEGQFSGDVGNRLFINTARPMLTGEIIKAVLDNHTLSLDWSNIFHWEDNNEVHYDVYVGSKEGASDLTKMLGTSDKSTVMVSKRFTHPMVCYCRVTAVVKSGMYENYMEQINIE